MIISLKYLKICFKIIDKYLALLSFPNSDILFYEVVLVKDLVGEKQKKTILSFDFNKESGFKQA